MVGQIRIKSNSQLKLEVSKYIDNELDNFDEIDSGDKYGVQLELWADNDCLYKDNCHKPWVYFRNGYNENADYIPMVITDDPYIPYGFECNVFDKDLLSTYYFVKNNMEILMAHANGEISSREFYVRLKRNAILRRNGI